MPPSPAPDPRARFFDEARAALQDGRCVKLVLAGPRGPKPDLLRVLTRPIVLKGRDCLSLTHHHRSRDVTRNLPVEQGLAALATLLDEGFDNLHLIASDGSDLQLAISRKGKATLRRSRPSGAAAGGEAPPASPEPAPTHDRAKRRLVDPRAPWLVELGVTDAQHRLLPSMARKWKQIDKFVEVFDHALCSAPALAARGRPGEPPLRVLDFGAGKGYLTFAVHAHLTQALGRQAEVTGIDLKADMVELGNRTARRLGLQDEAGRGLAFDLGDVSSLAPRPVDVMIALHACDVATDHAMHRGIRAGAQIILCSPCCHKQLRPQLRSPTLLLPLLRHGIHLGQEAEMLTDGLRALLLEAEGYDTQVFEFTSLEHTSKNKMILAVKRPRAARTDEAARSQVRELKAFYGVREQCLESLLEADRGVTP